MLRCNAGDANRDGIVTVADAKMIYLHLMHSFQDISPSPVDLAAADVDGNGKVEEADAKIIQVLTQGRRLAASEEFEKHSSKLRCRILKVRR